MMDTLMTIIYFVIAISILVFVHEFGHFITARLSGMRAEVFAVGMGYRLFGWNRVNGFTFGSLPNNFDGEGHTDYRIAAFPVGGYVKISGMVDESMDKNYAVTEPKPWEFRSKNAIQKAITISGGVIMNVILAFAIFTFIINSEGQDFAATTTIGSISEESLAEDIGLKTGDRIFSVNNKKVQYWQQIDQALLNDLGKDKTIELMRAQDKVVLHVDGKKILKALSEKKQIGFYPDKKKTFLTTVQTLKPAGKIGLKAGDTIVAINNINIASTVQFKNIISSKKNIPVLLTWKRKNAVMSDTISPNRDGIIGVGIGDAYTGPVVHKEYNLLSSIEEGGKETYEKTMLIVGSFAQMISGNVSFKQNVGGPIAIAKLASQNAEQGIISFLGFLALMSIMLAVVNILPFPALDGGHLVFIIIESIIRREVPIKAKLAIQQAGMFVLLAFMAFVIYLDITRSF